MRHHFNKKNIMSRVALVVGIVSIFFGILFFLFRTYRNSPSMDHFDGGGSSSSRTAPSIQLVVARYNEDLEWLKEDPYSKYENVIYNKSDNQNFTKSDNTHSTVNLPNVGRCDHTYLHHIIENYDNLANITVFLPGSLNMEYKNAKAKRLLKAIGSHKQNGFMGRRFDNVKDTYNSFQMDEWKATDSQNAAKNPETNLHLSEIRPFGKWYESKFKDKNVEYVSFAGIFSVSRNEILQHPKTYYEDLIQDLETSSNPEVGHYFERAWNAVFHPMTETKFIENANDPYE